MPWNPGQEESDGEAWAGKDRNKLAHLGSFGWAGSLLNQSP